MGDRRSAAWAAVIASGLLTAGCSCSAPVAPIDAATDTGPLFGGIDAPGYAPVDAGPRLPEPCGATVRRVRFPLGDGSVRNGSGLWGATDRVWVILGPVVDEAPSLHLFDLATEAEIPISIPLGEDSIHGLFPAGAGFEILLGDLAPSRLLRVDHDGRVLATASLRLEHGPRIRLPDGRFVSYGRALDAPRPGPARLEVAVPDGPTTSIDLGFLIEEDHLGDIEWTGELIVGVAYQLATSTILRFEVDLTSGIVDVRELMTGVIPGGSGPGSRDVMVWADAERVTAGIVYEPDGSPGAEVAELVWWPIGGSDVVRRVVRPLDTLGVDIIAFDGSPPRQTLALAQTSGSRAWISAARVEGPGAVIGGVEPLTIVSFYRAAAAWEPAPGSAALALMSARELEVIYLCEGVP